jgi:phosphate transport system protein
VQTTRGWGDADDRAPDTLGTGKVNLVRALFHTQLQQLLHTLTRTTRQTGQMITHASIAMHQADRALATLVITERDQLTRSLAAAERRCVTLLALQAPVARDLRVLVAVLRGLSHAHQMASLTQHVAVMAQFTHPNPMTCNEIRPLLVRMSLFASQLADDAATALDHQDPLSACRLAITDDELDTLQRQLVHTLCGGHWTHGIAPAVDAALLGRYYERFGDHAVALAQQACYLATGQPPQSPGRQPSTFATDPPAAASLR